MNNSDTNDITKFLPKDYELIFYQGCYYALTELLKKCRQSFTADLIKQELFDLKTKIIRLTTQPTPPTTS